MHTTFIFLSLGYLASVIFYSSFFQFFETSLLNLWEFLIMHPNSVHLPVLHIPSASLLHPSSSVLMTLGTLVCHIVYSFASTPLSINSSGIICSCVLLDIVLFQTSSDWSTFWGTELLGRNCFVFLLCNVSLFWWLWLIVFAGYGSLGWYLWSFRACRSSQFRLFWLSESALKSQVLFSWTSLCM